jgi:hypothetical protein
MESVLFSYAAFFTWCILLLFSSGDILYRLILSVLFYVSSVYVFVGLEYDADILFIIGTIGWSVSCMGISSFIPDFW